MRQMLFPIDVEAGWPKAIAIGLKNSELVNVPFSFAPAYGNLGWLLNIADEQTILDGLREFLGADLQKVAYLLIRYDGKLYYRSLNDEIDI